MVLADTHCHITKKYYGEPLQEVIRLYEETNLKFINIIGTCFVDNKENLDLKRQFNTYIKQKNDGKEVVEPPVGALVKNRKGFLQVAVGFHPEEVIKLERYAKHELERILQQIDENIEEIDLIGEIGLDTTYKGAVESIEIQKYVFSRLIDKAKQVKKPISIHTREAKEETMQIIKEKYPIVKLDDIQSGKAFKGYLHCFTDHLDMAKVFIERGFKLGIGGIATYKSGEHIKDVLLQVHKLYPEVEKHLLFALETDSPYLSPAPLDRKAKNSPENVKYVLEFLEK